MPITKIHSRLQAYHVKIGPVQKRSPGTILAAKKDPHQITFGCQKWSPLANSGLSRTKFGSQNWSGDHFWQPEVVQ